MWSENVKLFAEYLAKKNAAREQEKKIHKSINYRQFKKLYKGDTLPIKDKIEKLAEYKTKVLEYPYGVSETKPSIPDVVYKYNGLYINHSINKYFTIFHYRIVKLEDDTPKNFNKKLANFTDIDISTNTMDSIVHIFKKFVSPPRNIEELMESELSDFYDKRLLMIAAKEEKAKVKAAKKAAKELVLKMKTNKKNVAIAIANNNVGAGYTEKWKGINL